MEESVIADEFIALPPRMADNAPKVVTLPSSILSRLALISQRCALRSSLSRAMRLFRCAIKRT